MRTPSLRPRRLLRQRDRRPVAELRSRLGNWTSDVDEWELARFLRVEARARLLHAAAIAVMAKVARGEVKGSRLMEDAVAHDRLASQLAQSLGLTPLGRAQLAREVAGAERGRHDLAALWATEALEEGREW